MKNRGVTHHDFGHFCSWTSFCVTDEIYERVKKTCCKSLTKWFCWFRKLSISHLEKKKNAASKYHEICCFWAPPKITKGGKIHHKISKLWKLYILNIEPGHVGGWILKPPFDRRRSKEPRSGKNMVRRGVPGVRRASWSLPFFEKKNLIF